MLVWQVMMQNGNSCFDAQYWADAERYYYDALAEIEREWAGEHENVELMLAWISGQHNLSSLFEAQGYQEKALGYLTAPHDWLLTLSRDESVSENLRLIAMRALKITLTPLLEFSHRYPICEECNEPLQETQQWLERSQPVLH